MSSLLVIFILLSVGFISKAQDTILNRKGGEVRFKIIELDEEAIRYQFLKQRPGDNRVFNYNRKKVLAIKWDDGRVTDMHGSEINSIRFDYLKYDILSRRYTKRGIAMVSIGATFLAVGLPWFAYGINALVETQKNPEWDTTGPSYHMAGGFIAIPGIPLTVIGSLAYLKKGLKYKRVAEKMKADL